MSCVGKNFPQRKFSLECKHGAQEGAKGVAVWRTQFLLKEQTIWIVFLAIMDYLLTTIILERAEWKRVFVQMSKSPILASGCGAIFGEASLSFSTFSALLESPKKSSRMNRQPTHLPPIVESLMARSLAHRCIATKPTDLRCYRGRSLENLGGDLESPGSSPGACHHCNPC